MQRIADCSRTLKILHCCEQPVWLSFVQACPTPVAISCQRTRTEDRQTIQCLISPTPNRGKTRGSSYLVMAGLVPIANIRCAASFLLPRPALAIRAFTQQPVENGRERPFVCDGLWRGSG